MTNRNLADVLERLAKVGQAHADGVSPWAHDETCKFCYVSIQHEHELWCAWVEGRKLSQSDITAVERLARVLRYEV